MYTVGLAFRTRSGEVDHSEGTEEFNRSMMGNAAIQRLIEAIGYPDRVPDGDATSCTLRVDDGEVRVEVEEDRLMLKRVITSDGEAIARLAGYVPGRMLRENAVLAVACPCGRRGGGDAGFSGCHDPALTGERWR